MQRLRFGPLLLALRNLRMLLRPVGVMLLIVVTLAGMTTIGMLTAHTLPLLVTWT